jgi:hypothetical protein
VYLLVDAKWGLKLRDEELIELMERYHGIFVRVGYEMAVK